MRSIGPAILIVCFIALLPVLCWFLLSGMPAIIASWAVILIIALILFSMFSSVLFKGLGADRSVAAILLIAVSGIGALITQFSFLYHWTGLLTPSGEQSTSLFEAFYFSVVTWTTLGYGDFLPMDDSRHIVIVQALLGYVTMALMISVFVSVIARAARG